MSTQTTPAPTDRKLRRASRTAVISAAFVAVMVPGQFSFVAGLPIALVLISTLVHAQLRPLRWWAGGLAGLYVTALVLWATGPNPAPSLSKDMHPALTVLMTAAAVAVIVRYLTLSRGRGGRR